MGGADGADRFDVWLVVEHDAAAAIDLQVDEAGDEHAAGEIALRRTPDGTSGGDDASTVPPRTDSAAFVVPGIAVEDAGAGEGDQRRS